MKQYLKRFRIPLIVVGVLCLLLPALLIAHRTRAANMSKSEAQNEQADEGIQSQQTENPQTAEIAEDGAADIIFSDKGVRTLANEDAVKIDGTDVTIRTPGMYTLSGSCANGSVTVKKGTKDVTLVLDDLELTAVGTAAISCNKGTEVTIVAAEGSVNTLADTVDNNDETNPANGNTENAVLKSKDGAQVLLCGKGTLIIAANGKNGVKAGASDDELGEASLTISEITLNITAPNDGIKADSALTITDGLITVNAGDDAVCSDTAVIIGAEGAEGPTLDISGCTEGIEAPQVRLVSGDVSVKASDDGINAPEGDGTPDITIAGGTLYVDVAQGDGLDSNGTLSITGGNVQIFSSSRDDNSPIDSGSNLSITGGTVLAVGSSGMAQAPNAAAQTYLVFSTGNSSGKPEDGFGGESNSVVSFAAGDKVQILDSKGMTVAEAEALREGNYVYFTSPDLVSGETYTLNINGQSKGTATATDELSAFGGLPSTADPFGGTRPQMPGRGDFDPGNMQRPDGNTDPGTRPEFPEGDFDPDNMPQPPEGNFNPGSRPQPPARDEGAEAQSGATAQAGDSKDA